MLKYMKRKDILEIIKRNCCNEVGNCYALFPDELSKMFNLPVGEVYLLFDNKLINYVISKSNEEGLPDIVYICQEQENNTISRFINFFETTNIFLIIFTVIFSFYVIYCLFE